MSELKNTLSWSRSRASTLAECPRKYYYSYYGSWGGWSPEADARSRELYMLKQLRSRQMWAGELVHRGVERVLQELRATGERPAVEEVLRETRERMREDYRSSLEGRYRERPRTTTGLFEHHYRSPISAAEWRQNAEHVDNCLRNLFRSQSFQAIEELDVDSWLEIEDSGSFELDSVQIHVKLDFSFRAGDELVIVDWKTGRGRYQDHTAQFAVYALYARQQSGLEPRNIAGLEVNLALAQSQRHEFELSQLELAEQEISKSIAWMKDMLRDADANLALEEDFPKKESSRACGRCNFVAVCDTSFKPAPAQSERSAPLSASE